MHRRLAALLSPPSPAVAHLLRRFYSPEDLSDRRLDFVRDELHSFAPSRPPERPRTESPGDDRRVEVEISHPWPEWVKFMELLVEKGELDGRDNGFVGSSLRVSKDCNAVRTACLNFARNRPDIIRYLSRQDIQIIVKSGCPSLDRKVVNSAKRLRAHMGIQEGDVCSSCTLRGTCDRAFLKARDDEIGRTVDVMRIVLTYGLDIVSGLVDNPACSNKTVKECVRKVLNEIVECSSREVDHSLQTLSTTRPLSRFKKSDRPEMFKGQIPVPMKQGDWICPNGCFEDRLQKLREDQEYLPLKKGDWICEKCSFLNFAKNIKCLQCHEKPSNRQLNPGEWECPSCNYVNFQKNSVCLKCDWKRPKSFNSENSSRHQDQGSSKRVGYSFVIDGDAHEHNFQRLDEGSDDWGSLDDSSTDNDRSNFSAWKNFAELEKFPILGGKGAVSQDPLSRERWKDEMKRLNRGIKYDKYIEHGKGLLFSVPKSLEELDDFDEDDDIGEWFGVRKLCHNQGIGHSES